MKNILFISPNLSSGGGGGAERQLVNTAVFFKQAGYHVEVVTYAHGDFYANILYEQNIMVHWKKENNYFKRLYLIRKLIRSGKFDAVISFLHSTNFINNFSAIGSKSWKVITGERSSKESTFKSIKGKFFAFFQKFSDNIVCNSDNARRMWIKYYPAYKNKLQVIYNGVMITTPKVDYVLRKDNRTKILIAASYQYLKNPFGLIEAVSLLSNDIKEKIKIEWYGMNKGSRQRVYKEAQELLFKKGLEKTILLNPASDKIYNLMYSADVVALFSRVEGLPNVICEGMSLAKPIIMTRVSDYDTLVDKSNGFLCNWNEPESIASALTKVVELTNDELITLGRNSKLKAELLFSDNINKWIKLIE